MLPSPIIEGTLPAFYLDEDRGSATITIPFSMSRAVNKSEVKGFRLKLKYIQNGDTLMTPIDHSEIDFVNNIVKFILPAESVKNFKIGTFYKAQLAYVSHSNITGYYSSVGIIKYTTRPKISILNLENFSNNAHTYEYTGEYSQESITIEKEDGTTEYKTVRDATEKVYSYRFVIQELEGPIVKDTGFLLHNYSYDTDYFRSKDTFFFSQDLDLEKKYTITYTVRTNNGLEISSPSYRIISKQSVINRIDADLYATANYDNGYVNLMFQGKKNELGMEKTLKGSFLLTRSSNKTNFTYWEEMDRFDLVYQRPSSKTWTDFTIEQGLEYKYSIQQYNKNGLYSERLISNKIYADFEDSFLYDGERQLKIKFNPKVSSFKKDILESKVDTIGSKHPFIFRNGSVEYKEFPISGLISYLMDEEFLFFSEKDIFIDNKERKYKTKFIKINFPTNLAERALEYKKNYLFYYVEKEEGVYQRWINYLKEIIENKIDNTKTNTWDKIYNWYNWEAYKEEFKKIEDKLYLKSNVIINPIDFEKELVKTTNEVSYNIQLERMFKLEVLDWLTNGKPKLFRSPTEGNYLVRLLNSSLSPQDQLGRMLHTFSSTAYEIADINHENLVAYGIRQVSANTINNRYLKMVTIPFMVQGIDSIKEYIDYINYPKGSNTHYVMGNLIPDGVVAEWATISGVRPGETILIDGQSIVVGSSGTYEIPFSTSKIFLGKMEPVGAITKEEYLQAPDMYYITNKLNEFIKASTYIDGVNYYKANCSYSTGQITYAYMAELNDSFDQLTDTDLRDVLGKQVIGEKENIIDYLEDTVRKVATFYDIKVRKRPIIEVIIENNSVYDTDKNLIGSKKNNVIKINDEMIKVGEVEYPLNIKNILNLYSYKEATDDLYCKVEFRNTGWLDTEIPTDKERYSRYRTSTNEYLKDFKDFPLYVSKKKLYKLNGKVFELVTNSSFIEKDKQNNIINYYLKEDVEIIYDEINNKTYLSEKSYNSYQKMYMELEEEKTPPLPKYQTSIYIDDEEKDISISETEYFRTGSIMPKTIKTTVGVYLDLFYLEQSFDYAIYENAELVQLKNKLEEYKKKLQTHYMIEECLENGNQESYIQFLNSMIDEPAVEGKEDSYNKIYSKYLEKLDIYLEEISKEE